MEKAQITPNPVRSEISPITPPKSSRNIILGLALFVFGTVTGLLLSPFLSDFTFFGVPPRGSAPTNFDECIKDPQSSVQYTYPGTCVTSSGVSFTQPTPTPVPTELSCGGITNKKCPEGYVCETTAMYPDAGGTCTKDTTSNTYQCPASGWQGCMPILSEEGKRACSPEAMAWYKTNCPNFKGSAL